MNSNRDQIRKESPSNNGPDMAKTAGELWKTMSKSVSLHSQRPRIILNERFLRRPDTTTA